jgi:hypothetical protein
MASLPRWNSIKGTTTLRDFFALSGIALLLIVVAFEFLGNLYGQRKERLVEDARLTAAIEQQKEHDTEVGTLRQQLSDANNKIAALESKKAERRLSPDETHTLISAISPFPGQKISITYLSGDSYGKALAADFVTVMKGANWDYGGGEGAAPGLFEREPEGIALLINDADATAHKASGGILALVRALLDLHLISTPLLTGNKDVPAGAIQLVIGKGLPQPVL